MWSLAAEASGHCEPLYERTRSPFAFKQIAAIKERMETAWLRKLDIELMAQ